MNHHWHACCSRVTLRDHHDRRPSRRHEQICPLHGIRLHFQLDRRHRSSHSASGIQGSRVRISRFPITRERMSRISGVLSCGREENVPKEVRTAPICDLYHEKCWHVRDRKCVLVLLKREYKNVLIALWVELRTNADLAGSFWRQLYPQCSTLQHTSLLCILTVVIFSVCWLSTLFANVRLLGKSTQ